MALTPNLRAGNSIKWTNGTGADVVSGQLLAIGNLVGVAIGPIANGAVGMVQIGGAARVTKTSAAVITQGMRLILDVSNTPDALEDSAHTPASGDISNGCVALEAAAATVLEVDVLLTPGVGTVT